MNVLTVQPQGTKTAVVALVGIINQNNEMLLARCSARPHVWQPIGGHVETYDTEPADAIVREVAEETGLRLEKDDVWPVVLRPSDTGGGHILFYLASLTHPAPVRRQEDEIDELRWVALPDTKHLPVLPATRAFLNDLL